MRTRLITLLLLLLLNVSGVLAQISPNTVKYKLTYSTATEIYTVWVHPDYATPNANNANANEFSSTAQVSLKVPKAFLIQDITDIRGVWEKAPRKLGDPTIEPALATKSYDSTARYYAIGKAPIETNVGAFVVGDSLALFTFKGNACLGPVAILAPNDPFVAASINATSLNVRASFYSRSGQAAGGNVIPLEQFIAKKGPDANCQQLPQIGVSKLVTGVTTNNDGSFNVAFRIKVQNTGSVGFTNIQVFDTLSTTFPAPATFSIATAVTTLPVTAVNNSFSGTGSNTNLLAGSASLAAGDSLVLNFAVRVLPGGPSASYVNVAWGQGSAGGQLYRDRSTTGQNVDPDGNSDPGDNDIPTPILLNSNADIALRVGVNNQLPQLGDVVTIRLVAINQGQTALTGVEVKDVIPSGFTVTGSSGNGTYIPGTWTIGNIAVGDSAVINLTVQVNTTGVQYYTAEVSRLDQTDIDSSPNNGLESEDDFGRVCVSVPILLCPSQSIVLSIPQGLSGIQWFRNGNLLANETNPTVSISSAGTYTFTATNSTCPTGGCCPILVVEGDCCPINVCVPVVITRVRRIQ